MKSVVAVEMEDDVGQISKDLQTFLYHLRLSAEVLVVPLVSTIYKIAD